MKKIRALSGTTAVNGRTSSARTVEIWSDSLAQHRLDVRR
jgi:hypothetical protein